MKGVVFNPGQPQKRENFNTNQDAHETAIRERQLDLLSPGILNDSQDNSEAVPFALAPDTGLTIQVGTGVAIGHGTVSEPESATASDIAPYGGIGLVTGGERIVIPAADVSNTTANNYARAVNGGVGTGTGTGPFLESTNGIGGWSPTPQSTKTRNIPLTNGVVNYVWVGYLLTVDVTQTAFHKVNTSQVLYTTKLDGYDIVVTTSSGQPNGDPRYAYLGSVDLTSSPGLVTSSMINMSGRTYALTRANRLAFEYNPTLYAPSQAPTAGTVVSLESFLNAKGTGVVTPTNILGLTLADLGFTQDVNLQSHRLYDHSNGLNVPSTSSTTSALYPRTDTSTPVAGDSGMVYLKALSIVNNESLLLGGNVFDDSKVDPAYKLTSTVGGASAGDYFISFGSAETAGVYAIVAVQTGSLLQFQARISPYSYNSMTEYVVCTVQWDGTTFINPAPPSVQTDNRLFGTTSNRNLQANCIATGNVQDSSITNAKLATNSVTTADITDLNVTTSKLNDSAVISQKLAVADGTSGQTTTTGAGVKTGHLQDSAITSQKLAVADGTSGQVTTTGSGVKTDHIQDGAVTASKLASGAVLPTQPSVRLFIQGPAVKTDSDLGSSTNRAVAAAIVERSMTVSRIYMLSDTPPVGAPLVINIRTLPFSSSAAQWTQTTFVLQSTIPNGQHKNGGGDSSVGYDDASNNTYINNGGVGVTFAEGDRILVDIDSVGSTTAGGDDLLITIVGS